MAIELRVPAVAGEVDPSVELRPVYVEEWVDALPFADPVKLLDELLRAIARLNRTPAKPSVRFALMEIYLRPYQYLLDLEEHHGAVHSIVASGRNRAETDAARRAATELGYGFKHVVADTLAQPSRWGGAKQVGKALQRTALCLSHALMHSYHEYLPTPNHLWTELAGVYGYAAGEGLHTTPNPSSRLREDFATPIEGIYKRILLVSLVDPHHLAYGEVWEVSRAIGSCADAAEITAFGPVEKPAGFFVLDPARDRKPAPFDGGDHGPPAGRLRLLNSRPVIRALHAQSTRLRSGARVQTRLDQAGLIDRIVTALGRPPKRREERVPAEGQASFATGIATVHHFLGGASTGAAAPRPGEAGDGDGAVGDSRIGESTDFGRHSYAAEFWEVMNRGRGGIGVLRHLRPNRAVGVGELVGIRFDGKLEAGERWSVGVVRWMNVENAGEYQAGVEILARSAKPASAIVESPDDDSPSRTSAILLEASARTGSLVLPRGVFVENRILLIESPEETFRVRCTALEESTSSFDRGHYEPAT